MLWLLVVFRYAVLCFMENQGGGLVFCQRLAAGFVRLANGIATTHTVVDYEGSTLPIIS